MTCAELVCVPYGARECCSNGRRHSLPCAARSTWCAPGERDGSWSSRARRAGKTALLRAFVGSLNGDQVLWGSCDSLTTPRALGPLYDIAAQLGGDLARLLHAGSARADVFDALLRLLAPGPSPAVVVVEDAHWVDDATVDLLTFLLRRVSRTRALVIVSHRDDEIDSGHPLRAVLGLLDAQRDLRLTVQSLSPEAVAVLAEGLDIDARAAHEVTAGNAFFVTELMALGRLEAPPTVRDAVLAPPCSRGPDC